tara:strand:+ start:351 stop:1793 length:1443 start_codon:yes stop_codon:yes gene_type:complete
MELIDKKGTAYLQGIQGLNYLGKMSGYKKPMNILKSFLRSNSKRKTLHLKFNDGELEEVIKGVYQLKINPSDKNFLNDLRDELEDNGEDIDKSKTKPGQTITFKSGFQLYLSGRTLSNVIDETGNALSATKPTIPQQEDGFIINLKEGKLLENLQINKKVGFSFGKDWYSSYTKSFDAFTKKIIPKKNLSQYEFYRDSDKTKLEMLNQITDPSILPSSKDNWNPSDVWAVKKDEKNRLAKEIDKLYNARKKNNNVSIERINKFIETQFKNKSLIGISLKQVIGNTAKVDKITKDAKYINSVKFLRFGPKMMFDVTKTYFDINVKMACIKNDSLDYIFRFRPRGSSSATTNNAEGRLDGSGPADGAIDKKNVLSVLFPGADDIAKERYGTSKNIKEALRFLVASKKYQGLQTWVNKGNYKFLRISNLDKKADDKIIRRGLLNLNYAYLIDTYINQRELYKKFYLAAKKVNEFSSIHFKISG